VAEKDYPRLLKRLSSLTAPGAQALLCLNSPKLGPDFLHQAMAEHAPDWAFVQRLANPGAFADVSDARALKVMVWQRPE
jgi:23S rRNA (cytosine1962-C5)-methyltransferase